VIRSMYVNAEHYLSFLFVEVACMASLASLLSAIASLAWPLICVFAIIIFAKQIRQVLESRKFTIKVAGNELTVGEASEQQRVIISDIQLKIAELEKKLVQPSSKTIVPEKSTSSLCNRVLWVDDRPKNNSYIISFLEERGISVDTALSTAEGIEKMRSRAYDVIISDMGRPEGEKAGIDLAKLVRTLNKDIPVFIFCGNWAAKYLRSEAIQAGTTEITSSGTTLLSQLSRLYGY
jgi:CheY-like chemotaxis protein